MRRRHETEIKLEVRNPRVLKQRLADLGFRVIQPRHFESNALFDFPDLQLWKAHCLLRLRLAGRLWTLTFKGTPLQSREYKVRREIETEIQDGPVLREVLEALGLSETFRYEKYRTVFAPTGRGGRAAAAHLVFDETPIGNFLELEGSRRWIDQIARQLGYGRLDYITASYGSLYRAKCLERGEKPKNMLFHKS